MPDNKEPEIRPDDREQDNRPDRKQRKLADEGGKKVDDRYIDVISNTGGSSDNRGGEVLDTHLPIKDHHKKLHPISSDEVTGYEPGNNEEDLSYRAKEDRSSD